ncbi:MAG: ABC transporter permease [bacterium]|nr:ABC transporter permease [bacterium]
MRRILLIFKNDVKRRFKSPVTIVVLLLIPIIMTGIIGAIFAPKEDGNQLPKIKLLVVDKDKNIASKMLLGALDSKELKEMFQVTVVDETEGKKLISKGKASALLIIPEKFSDRLIKAEESELLLIKNPSQQFLPTVVEEFMNTFTIIISGFVQVFEPELKTVDSLINMPVEQLSIVALTPMMEKSKDKIVALKGYLSPLLLQLKEETTGKKEKKTAINVFSYVLPGMAIMFLLFIIEIFVRDILSEREDGKLQRMMFAPLKSMEFISARVISAWLMGIAVFLVMVVLGILLFNISWGNYFFLFVFAAAACFWIAAFFALLNSFFKNRNQAGAFSAPIIMVFSAFGGSIIQVDQLPAGLRWISQGTLNHWFIKGAGQISNGLFPTLPFAVILLTGIILFLLAAKFLNKRITV